VTIAAGHAAGRLLWPLSYKDSCAVRTHPKIGS